MDEIEIYWDDLTDEAQERIKLNHPEWFSNLQLCWPICTIMMEEDEDD